MGQAAGELTEKYPQFGFLTVVGGLANGSHVLRRIENTRRRNPSSDLDFYLGGHQVSPKVLEDMATIVQKNAREIGFTTDGQLNGKKLDQYLNLDKIDDHIELDEINLLALPFQASFGRPDDAKRIILEKVLARPDKQSLWDEIAGWHIQSLSLHHASWSLSFGNYILDDYYPKKIERFQLADTPKKL